MSDWNIIMTCHGMAGVILGRLVQVPGGTGADTSRRMWALSRANTGQN